MGNAKNIAFWAVAILLLVALFNVFSEGASRSSSGEIAFSDFLNRVENGQVREVIIDGEKVTGRLSDN
ncbi:MAG: ATP-dependent metallopeptidase FtsH/Yme1/Tma family protein, partial [Pseudomonadota bacterium]